MGSKSDNSENYMKIIIIGILVGITGIMGKDAYESLTGKDVKVTLRLLENARFSDSLAYNYQFKTIINRLDNLSTKLNDRICEIKEGNHE